MREMIGKSVLCFLLCQAVVTQAVITQAQVGSQVGAGSAHSLFIKPDGSLWAMGGNYSGQIGDGTTTQTNTPEMIVSSNVVLVAAGSSCSFFLDSTSNLWGMGDSSHGQLGLGATPSAVVPVKIATDVTS